MATQIMTTTLPAVVGMGVVSKTTDTMFGKGGRKASRSSTRTSRNQVRIGNRVYKVHVGSRGGKYIMRKGRKVYI